MAGEHNGHDFDESERARIRKTVDIVLGNGKPGLVNRMQRIELCGYAILVAAFTLFVQGVVTVRSPAVFQNSSSGSIAPQKPPKSVLTTEEVADELEVNADTVRRREKAGTLDGYQKIGENRWARLVHDSTLQRVRDRHESDVESPGN